MSIMLIFSFGFMFRDDLLLSSSLTFCVSVCVCVMPKTKYVCYMYTQNLGSWSASTSPARSPSPTRYGHHGAVQQRRRNHLQNPTYGTTSLCQRSRSPSPARLLEMRERDRLAADEMGTDHSKAISIFFVGFSSVSNSNRVLFGFCISIQRLPVAFVRTYMLVDFHIFRFRFAKCVNHIHGSDFRIRM